MSRFIISSLFLMCFWTGFSQSENAEQKTDTIEYKEPYGLRVGLDLSRPLRTFLNEDYQGFEIMGDYRISQKLYLAAEAGNEKRTYSEELGNDDNPNQNTLYNYTTSGSYLKVGADVNTYVNWYGMNNIIYLGGRYALSSHSQTVNSYELYNSNHYWYPDGLLQGEEKIGEYGGLSASWLEFVLGVKAELFANIYLGASVRLGILLGNKESDTFPNLWIPGFNKVTEDSRFGVGYNYSLTYLIPLYRKSKKPAAAEPTEE